MKHKGVIINIVKDMIPGSNFRVLKNGSCIEAKPKYDKSYQWCGGYPYSTKAECKTAIDDLIIKLGSAFNKKKIFIDVMNNA